MGVKLVLKHYRFDSRGYQIFGGVMGLERGPLSLERMTEELLEWKK
jgi:hypothetical protein